MIRSSIALLCLLTACAGPPTDEQRCDGGSGPACVHMAQEYAAGILKTKDLRKALTYYQRACDLKEAEGCLMLAQARKNGHGGVKDEGAAQKALSRACELGSVNGCRDFADALQSHGNTTGVAAARARGCKLGDDRACNLLDQQSER
jgi:TPR repeat protein